jgi:hypothetical protein
MLASAIQCHALAPFGHYSDTTPKDALPKSHHSPCNTETKLSQIHVEMEKMQGMTKLQP